MPLDNNIQMVDGKPRLLSSAEMAQRELARIEAGKYYVASIPSYDPPPTQTSRAGTAEYRSAPAFARAPLGAEPLPWL